MALQIELYRENVALVTTDSSPGRPWPAQLTDVVGAQIKRWRQERRMSAAKLAEKVTALGADFGFTYSRDQLINLERSPGRRTSISVGEVLIFAHVLEVPPTFLIAPVGIADDLEFLPGRRSDAWTVWRWLTGSNEGLTDSDYRYLINSFERHDKAVDRLVKALEGGDDRAVPLAAVVGLRSRIRSSGWRLPQLPPPGSASTEVGEQVRKLVEDAEAATEEDM